MLEARHLTRRYGDVLAVDDVSLTMLPGELTGFVGGNGAGKTTTMRMIMGLLQPNAGTVTWDGRPITADDRARFGYLPEERGLYAKQPVLDQLVYLGRLHRLSRAEASRRADDLLGRFGLGSRRKSKLEALSLGNQQRVQIIAALLHEPVAMVLDEPFSGLDPEAVDAMVTVLRERCATGVPVLFSSHQLDLVDRICDRLVILDRGRVVAAGTADELRSRPQQRYRLTCPPDAAWVRQFAGVTVVALDGATVILELADEALRESLLTEALRRGQLAEFSPVVPTLADTYREVTA